MKRCQTDALVRTVLDTWVNGFLDETISKVFNRLEKVLGLINEDEGGNDLVETKRGPRVESKFDFYKNWENIQSNRNLCDEFEKELEIPFGDNPNS